MPDIIIIISLIIIILVIIVLWCTSKIKDRNALKSSMSPKEITGSGAKQQMSALQSVIWPNQCYSKTMIDECQKFIHDMIISTKRFGCVSSDDEDLIEKESERLSKYYNIEITKSSLNAWRNMEVAYMSQTSGVKALRLAPEIFAAYNRGDSVNILAQRYSLPPLSVLRQILLEEKNSASTVNAMISGRMHMPARLSKEFQEILHSDLGSSINSEKIRLKSQEFENKLGRYLHNLDIHFETEEELRSKNQVLTPDFLLTEPVIINGKLVYWIDAKDYPFYGSKLVSKKLNKSVQKYTKAFGPGALIFSGGIMCNTATHVLFLDGSSVV